MRFWVTPTMLDEQRKHFIIRHPIGEVDWSGVDVAGRKVILYIEDMAPGESLSFQFQARALYPVRAKAVTSEVYSYYNPNWKGETIGGEMLVAER